MLSEENHPKLKRCLSAIPRSPHLHPIKTSLYDPRATAEKKRTQTPGTTSRMPSKTRDGAEMHLAYSLGHDRPNTAPELMADGGRGPGSPIGFPMQVKTIVCFI